MSNFFGVTTNINKSRSRCNRQNTKDDENYNNEVYKYIIGKVESECVDKVPAP